jgi:ferredoxin
MRVRVDSDRCQGHARCWDVAPEVYDLDDLGYCRIAAEEVPAELEEAARKGAAVCPERAITVED